MWKWIRQCHCTVTCVIYLSKITFKLYTLFFSYSGLGIFWILNHHRAFFNFPLHFGCYKSVSLINVGWGFPPRPVLARSISSSRSWSCGKGMVKWQKGIKMLLIQKSFLHQLRLADFIPSLSQGASEVAQDSPPATAIRCVSGTHWIRMQGSLGRLLQGNWELHTPPKQLALEKMDGWKTKFLLVSLFFRGYSTFRAGMILYFQFTLRSEAWPSLSWILAEKVAISTRGTWFF